MSLRAISTELAKQGRVIEASHAFNPKSVAVILAI